MVQKEITIIEQKTQINQENCTNQQKSIFLYLTAITNFFVCGSKQISSHIPFLIS